MDQAGPADRLTGGDALRDRALIYLLLNAHRGHDKLRPGVILSMDVEDSRYHGSHTTWKVKPKSALASATVLVTISRDASRAIDAYTGRTPAGTHEPPPGLGRVTNPTYNTHPSRGALFTGSVNRALGARLSTGKAVARSLQHVLATHEELAPYADRLSPDFIAATPPPTPPPTRTEPARGAPDPSVALSMG